MSVNSIKRTGLWFLVVGATSALVHFGVFALTRKFILAELANLVGFAVGFCVSFAGHRFLSFSDTALSLLQSLKRFSLTAGAGFLTNELVFMALFRGLGWIDLWALLCALVLAAAQTFVLSRYWAFVR